jgi:hypothetical protein
MANYLKKINNKEDLIKEISANNITKEW